MMLRKKGQLTIFIILGILLLIIGAFFIYTRLSSSEREIQTETSISQETALDALPVQRYIEDCLDTIAKAAVKKIGLQGGALYGYVDSPTEPDFLGDGALPAGIYILEDNLFPREVYLRKNIGEY